MHHSDGDDEAVAKMDESGLYNLTSQSQRGGPYSPLAPPLAPNPYLKRASSLFEPLASFHIKPSDITTFSGVFCPFRFRSLAFVSPLSRLRLAGYLEMSVCILGFCLGCFAACG